MKTVKKPINRVAKYGAGGFLCDNMVLTPEEQATLRRMAKSKNYHARKRCAEWLKVISHVKANHPLVLELADVLIPDRSENIRWGILTIALSPKLRDWDCSDLWPLVVKWGSVRNTDIRIGVGVCVLEHILEQNFTEYFGRAQHLIETGNHRFGYTLAYAGRLGQAKEPQNIEEYNAFFATLPSYPYTSQYLSYSQPAA